MCDHRGLPQKNIKWAGLSNDIGNVIPIKEEANVNGDEKYPKFGKLSIIIDLSPCRCSIIESQEESFSMEKSL